MKHLLQIVQLLTKQKISKIELLDEQVSKSKDSKFGIFYQALASGKVTSDEEAVRLLYGVNDTSDVRYRKLKSRFKRRLYNTLFFIDLNTPLAKGRRQAFFNCQRDWATVEIMRLYSARQPSAALARQILTTALKFHFSEMAVKCARLLREQSIIDQDPVAFAEYDRLIQEQSAILSIEMEAEQLSQQAQLIYQQSHRHKDALHRLEAIGNALIRLTEKIACPILQCRVFTVWVLYYETAREFEPMLEISRQAADYVRQNADYYDPRQQAFFPAKSLTVHLHLQQYAEGKAEAEKTLQQLKPDNATWLDFMELYFLLSLHSDYYINAVAIYNRVTDSPAFKKRTEGQREKWALFESFLHYIIEKEQLNIELLVAYRKKAFRQFYQPTEGNSWAPVVQLHYTALKLLIQTLRRNFSAKDFSAEILQKLLSYKLKQPGYERAAAFAHLLLLLEKADFQPRRIKGSEKHLQLLQAQKNFYDGRLSYLEVIPYEKLWQFLCLQLA